MTERVVRSAYHLHFVRVTPGTEIVGAFTEEAPILRSVRFVAFRAGDRWVVQIAQALVFAACANLVAGKAKSGEVSESGRRPARVSMGRVAGTARPALRRGQAKHVAFGWKRDAQVVRALMNVALRVVASHAVPTIVWTVGQKKTTAGFMMHLVATRANQLVISSELRSDGLHGRGLCRTDAHVVWMTDVTAGCE